MTLPFHPVAGLFNLIEGDQFEELVNDIALHGVREPVWIYQGQVIDGRNRCRAHETAVEREKAKPEKLSLVCPECERIHHKKDTGPPTVPVTRSQAGQSIPCPHCEPICDRAKCQKKRKQEPDWKGPCEHRPTQVEIPLTLARQAIPPLPVREWDGKGSLVAFVMSLNVYRRHLDESQRSMLGARAAPMMEEEARQRQKAGLKQGAASPLAPIGAHGKNQGKTAETVAKLANVSTRSIERAKTVISKGTPQLVAAVDKGKVSVSKAASIAKLTPTEQLAKIKAEGQKAESEVRQHDLRDTFDRWAKIVEKLHRQFQGHDPTVLLLVKWAEKGKKLLDEELARLLTPPKGGPSRAA